MKLISRFRALLTLYCSVLSIAGCRDRLPPHDLGGDRAMRLRRSVVSSKDHGPAPSGET